jgi:uncharacterized protein DUF6644
LKFIADIMGWIEKSPVGEFASQSIYAFAALDMIHIAAISIVVGMIALLDLRLMGVAFTDYAVTAMARQVLPWTWSAFIVAAATGLLMFTGQAVKYSVNFAFLMKLTLMAIAGINVLLFHFIIYRSIAKWDKGAAVPRAGKIAGMISLACWVAIVFYGRFTAYYQFP